MKKHPQPFTSAVLYARVSSDRQDVVLSVAAQLRALTDYAEKNGYLVAREYIDEAESGRVADRPEFRKMIDEGSKSDAPFEVILLATNRSSPVGDAWPYRFPPRQWANRLREACTCEVRRR